MTQLAPPGEGGGKGLGYGLVIWGESWEGISRAASCKLIGGACLLDLGAGEGGYVGNAKLDIV